jgi:hypothetical protein
MHGLKKDRFIDCEKWRQEFNLDELVRTFDYTEKAEVFEFYPQYYHKTDKVGVFFPSSALYILTRELGWPARIHRAAGQHRPDSHVQDHDG